MSRTKIAIFSGTFDPPHAGHEWLTKHVLEKLRFDEVWMLVEPDPRHKANVSKLRHRQAMVKKLFADTLAVKVDPLSILEDQHTLAGTFEAAKQLGGEAADFWLIVGGDVFEFVPAWPGINDYTDQIGFIVGLRSEDDGELAMQAVMELPRLLYKLVPSESPGVSSTDIRLKLSMGEESRDVSTRVLDYIKQNNLYAKDES